MSDSNAQYNGRAPGGGDAETLNRIATQMFEIVPDFAPVFTRQLLKQVPGLGNAEDKVAYEATRKSALGSMYELLAITRAGIMDPSMMETSPEALEHTRYLHSRGVGFDTVLRFYHIGVSMFEPLMVHVAEPIVGGQNLEQLKGPLRQFIFTYVDRITKRLAVEFGTEREGEGWDEDPNAQIWHNEEAVDAVDEFLHRRDQEKDDPTDGSAARDFCADALERFCETMEAAARDQRLCQVLSRSNTSLHVHLLDEPDLEVSVLLDRDPIEVNDSGGGEIELGIVSVDLARMYSPDFHVAMAIARRRITYKGPVRKFLRVSPVVRHASLPQLVDGDHDASDTSAPPTVEKA